MKAFLTALFLALMLVSTASAEKADKEPAFNYLAEVDTLMAEVNVRHTIYKGMPIENLKANFENLDGWTFKDEGLQDPNNPKDRGHRFSITRQYSKSTPVYEIIKVYTDLDNQTVMKCDVAFYATESAARLIYSRMVKNYTQKLGQPNSDFHGNWSKKENVGSTHWNKARDFHFAEYIKYKKGEALKIQNKYGFPVQVNCKVHII